MKKQPLLATTFLLSACASAPQRPVAVAPIVGAVMKPVVRQPAPPPKPVFNARDFGAKGDGTTNDTAALRKAISACAGSGGSVLLDKGVFRSGNLTLQGGMTLYLAQGATLKATDDPADFPVVVPKETSGTAAFGTCKRSFLYADHADDLHLDGLGTVDGNAEALKKAGMAGGKDDENLRPSILRVFNSKHVSVRHLTLQNGLMWTQVYDQCEDLAIENQIVRCPPVHRNHDGMDLCNCRQVVVRGNDLETEDDVICLKSHGPAGMKDVLIENNTLYCHGANAIKFGTSTVGDIQDVRIFDNTVRYAKLGGLCIESVDGAKVSNIHVCGLTLTDTMHPIFIRLALRGAYPKEIDQAIYPKAYGSLTGVLIENVVACPTSRGNSGADEVAIDDEHIASDRKGPQKSSWAEPACTVTGVTAKPLGDITFRNVHIVMPGGVLRQVGDPPENDKTYPQSSMFGRIPASVFFVRHAGKVVFENVEVGTAQPDARPWLRAADATVEEKNVRSLGVVAPGK